MREITGNFSRPDIPLPIPVTEDTLFKNCNFAQPTPHTVVFDVKPGVALEFEDCNLINVTVPDGAAIRGGNLAHLVRVETGGATKPFINTLHECEKCAAAVKELREAIEAGDLPKDKNGRILHHAMKERYAARRDFDMLVEADEADLSDENAAALEKWGK